MAVLAAVVFLGAHLVHNHLSRVEGGVRQREEGDSDWMKQTGQRTQGVKASPHQTLGMPDGCWRLGENVSLHAGVTPCVHGGGLGSDQKTARLRTLGALSSSSTSASTLTLSR